MGRKAKFSQEKKLEIIGACLEGKASSGELARRYGCNDKSVLSWVEQYLVQGEEAFRETHQNQTYTAEFKHIVVKEYQQGGISLRTLAIKYNIRSTTQIRKWVKLIMVMKISGPARGRMEESTWPKEGRQPTRNGSRLWNTA